MSTLTIEEKVLRKAAPAVFEKVVLLDRLYPELNGRALAAGYLAAADAVASAPQGPDHVYYVASSTPNGGSYGVNHYTVEKDAKGTLKHATCTCPDYFDGFRGLRNGAPRIQGNPKCKHILALAILRAIEKDQEKASVQSAPETEALPGVAHSNNGGPSHDSTARRTEQAECYESASVRSMSRLFVDAMRSIQGRSR